MTQAVAKIRLKKRRKNRTTKIVRRLSQSQRISVIRTIGKDIIGQRIQAKGTIHKIVITNHPERVVINIIIVIIGLLGRAPAKRDTVIVKADHIIGMEQKTRADAAPAVIDTIIKVVSVVRGMNAGIEVVINITAVAIHLLLNLLLRVVVEVVDHHLHLLKDTEKETSEEGIIAAKPREEVLQLILMCILTSKRERYQMQWVLVQSKQPLEVPLSVFGMVISGLFVLHNKYRLRISK